MRERRNGVKISISLLIGLLMLLWAPGASAFTFQWVPLDSTLVGTGDFATEWSKTLPGWNITEGSRAWHNWTISSGGSANYTSYDTNTSKLWLIFGSASATLSTATDSLVFLMHGDYNDGYGNFYVDNVLIDTEDMYDSGSSGAFRALIVEGLDVGLHTLMVERAGIKNPNSSGYDLAIIGGGALAPCTSAVPIPGAIWLLGSGLFGLAGLRRKIKG